MRIIFGILIFLPLLVLGEEYIYEKQYSLFKVWLDCKRHGPIMVYYELDKDTGDILRPGGDFNIDPLVPSDCEYKSGKAFGKGFDRGHLVPANQLDESRQSLKESFYITNMLPQQSRFNRNGGAWYETEKISECYREISHLKIWAGVIYGDNKENDLFILTHGIETPDYWWKLIYRSDKNEYTAWLFPNSKESTREKMDSYILSKEELIQRLGFVPDFGVKDAKLSKMEVSGNNNYLNCEGNYASGG